VTIFDVKLHYTNESVEKHLKGFGAKMVKPVSYVQIKDSDGQETEFINGDRITFVDAIYIQKTTLFQNGYLLVTVLPESNTLDSDKSQTHAPNVT
jgi:hypothetical protein